MFLDALRIIVNGQVRREIPFRMGVNLIVDKASSRSTESGNSVGKTTVLRVVDFCFGSKGDEIYKDSEFKSINQEVFDFLTRNDVVAHLTLRSRFGETLELRRDISPKPKLFRIGQEEYGSLAAYQRALKEAVFYSSEEKPTLRQVMPKFIRSDAHRMSMTLKFLHGSTSDVVYESIFLFLFGFSDRSLLPQKQVLVREIKKERQRLEALCRGQSENALEQMIAVVNRDIEEQQAKIDEFQLGAAYKEESEALQELQRTSSDLSLRANQLKMRFNFAKDTIKELESNIAASDAREIKAIYEEARRQIPSIQKSFEDALTFHNQMIQRKVSYLKKNADSLAKDYEEVSARLDRVLERESEILRRISREGSLNDLRLMQDQLNRLYESKGQKEQLLDQIREARGLVEGLREKLEDLSAKISEYLDDLNRKLTLFNKEFSKLSKKFYDEEYVLSYSEKDNKILFSVNNMDVNVGGGKKKAQVAAFDLAYINFARELNMRTLSFVMHDSIEDVHANQVATLLSAAEEMDGQYVVAVLKEKLAATAPDYLKEATVVELDEADKFFRF